jgi:valyl-tRNA synthetase
MMGLYFMKEVPFRRVLLSGLIVDETGEKMSKVKGNVIDPLDLIYGATFAEVTKKTLPGAPEAEALAKFKKAYPSAAQMGAGFPGFGADALRFTLATFPPSNKRIALALKRIEGYRFFVNKIWNATRFSLDKLAGLTRETDKAPEPGGFYSRWILSRLGSAIRVVHAGMGGFRIDEAANELYRFFWNDLCDWYLELCKPVFAEGAAPAHAALAGETKETLAYVLDASLRLLHPMMPYVTEELWQRLPRPPGAAVSIALARYPEEGDCKIDPDVDREMATLQAVIGAARTIRSEHEVKPAALVPLTIRTDVPALSAQLQQHENAIMTLVKAADIVKIEPVGADRAKGSVVSMVATDGGTVEVLVGLKGLVEATKERARIDREIKGITKDLAAVEKKLGSPAFMERAPKELVEEAKAQRDSLIEALERLEEAKKLADELDTDESS